MTRLNMLLRSPDRLEQLSAKLDLYGPDEMDRLELAEFFLLYCKPDKGFDAKGMASRLLERFGNISNLMQAPWQELAKVEGMGKALSQRLAALGDYFREYVRYTRFAPPPAKLRTVNEMCSHILPLYRRCLPPCTWQLNLNEDFELIFEDQLIESRAWGESDFVEQSMEDAYMFRAKHVIIVQMCGRELADPKPYDKKHAKLHSARLGEIGVNLLDVVSVDEGKIFSMREMGLLGKERQYPFVDRDKIIERWCAKFKFRANT